MWSLDASYSYTISEYLAPTHPHLHFPFSFATADDEQLQVQIPR